MSDLQILLIIIGALIIAAVLVLNWWQERRFHQQVKNSFSDLQSDALLDEPDLDISKLDVAKEDFADDDFSIKHSSIDDTTITSRIHDRYTQSDRDEISHEITDELTDEFTDDILAESAAAELMDQQSAVEVAAAVEPPVEIDPITAAAKATPDTNTLHHDGIKAIFNEAFSNAPTSATQVNNTVAPATDNANKIDLEEPALSLPAMLHAQMDLVAMLYLANESTIGELDKAFGSLFDNYDKATFVHVLDSDSQWLLLKDVSTKPEFANHKVSKVTCSLQLADRAGPVSRGVLNRFQLAVETLGLDINAHVEWQSTGDALAQANALDAFCIEVDKTMGFHLMHGESGAFTGTKLRGLAEAQGLELSSDGTFKYYDEATNKQALSNPDQHVKTPSFVMFNHDHYPFSPDMLRSSVVKAVTFQLDIPHVKHCTEAFNHMVQVARQMEVGLNAVLVDDNNKALGDIQIEKIRHQLKVIHATMLARGIVPGSDSALRLFS